MVNCSPCYDGQPYSFSQSGMISLPGKENGGIVGTLGPGPTPPVSRPDPRASRGLGPELAGPGITELAGPGINRPMSARPRHYRTSRPMSARPTFRPGTWGFHSPDGLFSSGAYFPEQQLSQVKVPVGFPFYKRKFTHELTPSPPTK